MRHFSPSQLEEHLKAHSPVLLDVREPWEFAICHLENSRLLPMRTIPHEITSLDRESETVVICHHGIRSRTVCEFLQHSGFADMINLDGGLDAWARQVNPSMAVY